MDILDKFDTRPDDTEQKSLNYTILSFVFKQKSMPCFIAKIYFYSPMVHSPFLFF